MSSTLLDIYIRTLVERVNRIHHTYIPATIDLIFDGGAFNGGMGLGVAMYLKELEKTNRIKVKRVSGCSIGSLIALYYLTTMNYNINDMFLSISKCFKQRFDLTQYAVCVRDFIFNHMTEDLSLINNALHITYYDMVLGKQIVESSFESREHLAECIIRSSHVPFISNREFKYMNRYLDGISPHVFNDRARPAIFVMIVTRFNFHRVLNVVGENNVNERLLVGINDIDTLLTSGKSRMCSYYNEWSLASTIMLRIREVVFLYVIICIEICSYIYKFIPHYVKNSKLFNGFINICWRIYDDIIFNGIK